MKNTMFKKTIALFMTMIMILSAFPIATVFAQDYSKYVDFPTGWSAEAVGAAIDNGLLIGKTANTLDPEGKLTRAEMATIINRAFGSVIEADISKFIDVSKDAWYYSEIAKAVNMETFQGDGGNTMRPDDNITREEVFVVVARALVLESKDYTSLAKFNDAGMISDWAKPYISILTSKGYVNGDTLSNVNPKANISREEFAQLMHNIFKEYITEAGTYKNSTIDGSLLMVNKGSVKLSDMIIYGDLVIGDGVHTDSFTLENVKVYGRILVRGGQKPAVNKLTKTTATEGIVVKNVNGTVYFDNYKTDSQFKKITAITPVEFKKSTGGSGGGTAKKYTLSFETNGGTPISSVTYKSGTIVDLSDYTTTKEGFVFEGWYLEADFQTKVGTVKLYDDMTVYANWVPEGVTPPVKHRIIINANGGIISTTEIFVEDGKTILDKLPAVEKNNLKFGGWYKDSEFKDELLATDTATAPMEVFAKWVAVITFMNGTEKYAEREVVEKTTLSDFPAEPTKTGYEFTGWYTSNIEAEQISDNKFDSTKKVDAHLTVYAGWKLESVTPPSPTKHKITININGGTIENANGCTISGTEIYVNVEDGETILDKLPTVIKNNLKFGGWYKDSEFKDELLATDTAAGEMTVFVKWVAVITFMNGTEKVADREVVEKTKLSDFPAEPTKTGYEFTGWYTSDIEAEQTSTTKFDETVVVYGHMTVYPGWTKESVTPPTTRYTLTFNTNGGTPIQAIEADKDTIIFLGGYKTTKDGYNFEGWYFEPELKTKIEEIKLDKDRTVHANWTPEDPTVEKWKVTFTTGLKPISVVEVEKGKTLRTVINELPNTYRKYTNSSSSPNTYNHDVAQEGWYDDSRTEYTLDTAINSDIELYPGWQYFYSYLSTTRFNIPGLALSLYYNPDDSVIDAATDFIFDNRPVALEGIKAYDDKVLSKPIVQKLITYPDKEIKIFKLNIGLSDVFDSSEQIKARFKSQIDTVLQKVPDFARADIEKIMYAALDDVIADDKLDLKKNNMINMQMPLSQIFGSEASLRKMLDEATADVLNSVPDADVKAELQKELDNVIDFIVKSDKNAVLTTNKMTNVSMNMSLKEFFGDETAFATMLKEEADKVLASTVPADIIDDIKDDIHTSIDELAKKDKWIIDDHSADKNINVELPLNQLFGKNDEFANMIKDEIAESVKDLDTAIQAELNAKLGVVVDKLANKAVWSLDDPDGFTTIHLDEPVAVLFGGINEFTDLIKDEIDERIAPFPDDIEAIVRPEAYKAIEKIAAKDQWQIGDADGIANVNIPVSLDDIFGGDGEFAKAVKTELTNRIATLKVSYPYIADVETDIINAIDKILLQTKWNIGYADGILTALPIKMTPDDIFGGVGEFVKEVNDKMNALLTGLPKFAEAPLAVIKDKVNTMLGKSVWNINDDDGIAKNVNVTLTPADILGDTAKTDAVEAINNKIAKLNGKATIDPDFKAEDFVDTVLGEGVTVWDYNKTPYNAVEVKADFVIRDAFGGDVLFADEIKDLVKNDIKDLSESSKLNINKAIENIAKADKWKIGDSAGMATVDFKTSIKDFVSSDFNLLLDAGVAVNNADAINFKNAIDGEAEYGVTDSNILYVEKFRDGIAAYDFTGYLAANEATLSEEIKAARAYLNNDALIEAELDTARDAYINKINSAITNKNTANNKFSTVLTATHKLDVTEIFIDKMISKIREVNYTKVENNADIVTITGVVEKAAVSKAIDDAVTVYETMLRNMPADGIDSKLGLSIDFNVNKVFLEEMKSELTAINNETEYKNLINEKLRKFVTLGQYRKAVGEYINSITYATDNKTTMNTAMTIELGDINVTKLMLEEMEQPVRDIDFRDINISEDVKEILGDNIENTFKSVRDAYADSIAAAANSSAESFYVNEIKFQVDINVNELFLNEMRKQAKSKEYKDDVKTAIHNMLGADLINMVGDEVVGNKFNQARDNYVDDIDAALKSSEKSVGKEMTISADIDITELMLKGIETEVDALTYEGIKDKLPKDLRDVVGDDALAASFLIAQSDYHNRIEDSLKELPDGTYKPFKSALSADVENVNVNKLLMEGMKSKINDESMTYEKIADKIDQEIRKYIGDEKLKPAYNSAKSDYAAKIDAVLAKDSVVTKLDNKIPLDVTVNINELIIKGLDTKLESIKYSDVSDRIDASIRKALGDEAVEKAFDEAMKDYRTRIDAINAGTSNEFDTSVNLKMTINISELVIDGLVDELNAMTFDTAKGMIDKSLIDLLGEEYLEEVFDTSKANMITNIENAMNNGTGIKGDVFHITLSLDAYRIVLKEINERVKPIDYDYISERIPDTLLSIVGEEILEREVNKVLPDLKKRINDAYTLNYLDKDPSNDVEQLDCELRLAIDFINDILKPEYDRYVAKAEEKLGTYYTDNVDLVEIRKILTPDNLLKKVGDKTDDLTGYKLREYDEYYNILEQVVLLADGAINKASDQLVGTGKLDNAVSTYIDLTYDYYAKIIRLARKALERTDRINVDLDEILPSDETLESFRPKIKAAIIELVSNPDMSVEEAADLTMKFTGRTFDWKSFEKETTKKQVTVKVKSDVIIPWLE